MDNTCKALESFHRDCYFYVLWPVLYFWETGYLNGTLGCGDRAVTNVSSFSRSPSWTLTTSRQFPTKTECGLVSTLASQL